MDVHGADPGREGRGRDERRLQLRPGVSGSVDVRVGEDGVPPDMNSRRTLRAEIVGFNPQPDPPGDWFTTLEVIDAQTGRSTILLGGPDTARARSDIVTGNVVYRQTAVSMIRSPSTTVDRMAVRLAGISNFLAVLRREEGRAS